MKIYQSAPEEGFTKNDIKRGAQWLFTDITCPHCGREQSLAATQYFGGPCIRCGKLTGEQPYIQI